MSAYAAPPRLPIGNRFIPLLVLGFALILAGIGGAVVMEDLVPLLLSLLGVMFIGFTLYDRSKVVEMFLRDHPEFAGPRPLYPVPPTASSRAAPPPAPTRTVRKFVVRGTSRQEVAEEILRWALDSQGAVLWQSDMALATAEQLARVPTLGQGLGKPRGTEYLVQIQMGVDPTRRLLDGLASRHPDWFATGDGAQAEALRERARLHPQELLQEVLGRHPEWNATPEGVQLNAESAADQPRIFAIAVWPEASPQGEASVVVLATGYTLAGGEERPFLEAAGPGEVHRRKGWEEMEDLEDSLAFLDTPPANLPAAAPPAMAPCPKCSTPLTSTARFCGVCGWPVPQAR